MSRPAGGSLHDRQHGLIRERLQALQDAQGRPRRREAHKKVIDTLSGHLQQCHGIKVSRLKNSPDELVEIHRKAHEEEIETKDP